MRSNATVRFLYGLAGNEGTRAVTIAYDIKWSERPILAYTDSFGIGWIAANENSIEVVTKVDDVTGEIAYFYSATEDSACQSVWRAEHQYIQRRSERSRF